MSYRIEFTSKARDSLSRLPKRVQARLAAKIELLADDPRPAGAKKIRGQNDCYRIRQGDYRVVYVVLNDLLLVVILRAGHRREVYERTDTIARMIEHLRQRNR